MVLKAYATLCVMGSTQEETAKRLFILQELIPKLQEGCIGILLGGSMAYGQNYSIREGSDIDLGIILPSRAITNTYVLEFGTLEQLTFFTNGIIDMFWLTPVINGVEVNIFVYEKESYEAFFKLEKPMQCYLQTQPSSIAYSYNFEGMLISFNRVMNPLGNGWVYIRNFIMDGRYVAISPAQDYIYSAQFLYDPEHFLEHMEKTFWKVVIGQLVKEYGKDPDLTKTSILNLHYTYMKTPERVPKEIVKKIQERTQNELIVNNLN